MLLSRYWAVTCSATTPTSSRSTSSTSPSRSASTEMMCCDQHIISSCFVMTQSALGTCSRWPHGPHCGLRPLSDADAACPASGVPLAATVAAPVPARKCYLTRCSQPPFHPQVRLRSLSARSARREHMHTHAHTHVHAHMHMRTLHSCAHRQALAHAHAHAHAQAHTQPRGEMARCWQGRAFSPLGFFTP